MTISLRKRIAWRLADMGAGFFWFICSLMKPEQASEFGAFIIGRVGSKLASPRFIKSNIAIAFPEKSQTEINDMTGAILANAGRVFAEYPHLGAIIEDDEVQRFEFTDHQGRHMDKFNPRTSIFVTAHMANWELNTALLSITDAKASVIYTPRRNPYIDRRIQKFRSALKCDFMKRNDAMRQMVRLLRKGTCVGIVMDQRYDKGEPVPFFGHDAMTALGPARLALKLNIDLVPVNMKRIGPARYRLVMYPPIIPANMDDETGLQAHDMTCQISKYFESWIRENPDQWFCLKRRWPKEQYR